MMAAGVRRGVLAALDQIAAPIDQTAAVAARPTRLIPAVDSLRRKGSAVSKSRADKR